MHATVKRLLPFYIVYYATTSIHNVYFSLYLYETGLSTAWVGTMISLAPLAAILGQPVWGTLGDRARFKHHLLIVLSLGAIALMAVLPASEAKWYVALIYSAFSFFYLSIQPVADTIALESLAEARRPFGPVRMGGTIAFAILSYVSGTLLQGRILMVPYIIAAMLVLVLLASLPMPRVKGHRMTNSAAGMKAVLKCKPLMCMIAFSGLMMAGMSFYYGYYSIFVTTQLGGTTADVGLAFLIGSSTEVPFLIFSDRIYERMGIGRLLMVSASIMTLRWVITFFVPTMQAALWVQLLHCGCFLPMTFAMSKFINAIVPDSHKVASQLLYTLVTLNLARILANFSGGWIAELIGLRSLFLCAAGITLAALVIFGVYVLRNGRMLLAASRGTLHMNEAGKLVDHKGIEA